jgi:hypothetical protein
VVQNIGRVRRNLRLDPPADIERTPQAHVDIEASRTA